MSVLGISVLEARRHLSRAQGSEISYYYWICRLGFGTFEALGAMLGGRKGFFCEGKGLQLNPQP